MIETESYILVSKPAGFLTHSDSRRLGFIDWLQDKLQTQLKIVHRLDEGTSGAMIFAKNKEAAKKLTEAFTDREVKKKYTFISDKTAKDDEFCIETSIDNKDAKTSFKRINEHQKFSLWEATPETGRTHQIRIHAKEAGIPILGDVNYSGSNFARMMLHCQDIEWEDIKHHSPLPALFNYITLFSRPQLCEWVAEKDKRQTLYPEEFNSSEQTLRIIDQKEKGYTCDKMGETLWFYRFRKEKITNREVEDIHSFVKICGSKKFVLRQMENRGHNPELQQNEAKGMDWRVKEADVEYLLSNQRGWSPGLFLDQRKNRLWVKNNSKNKSVLNLFCYTSGFSSNAALGGAKEVVSVDSSKATLDWSKENFALNDLNPENYEFWAADARDFLKGCVRRKRKFDIIVCDPPSFARSKKSIFRIQDDAEDLVKTCLSLLNKDGHLLFSCNYEKWTPDEFLRLFKDWSQKFDLKKVQLTNAEWDYSLDLPMKSILATRA